MKKIIFCLLVIVFNGCYHPKLYFQKLRSKYQLSRNVSKGLLKTNEYYRLPRISDLDTSYLNIVFYKSGIILHNFDIDYFLNEETKFYSRGPIYWGTYIIKNDTIFAQTIESPGGMSFSRSDFFYKIINDSTIRKIKLDTNKYNLLKVEEFLDAKFVKYNDIPDYNKSWLIMKKKFWKSKEEYKKWKKEYKQ